MTAHHPVHRLSVTAPEQARDAAYRDARARIDALLADEPDWVAAMATVASELRASFDYYDWVGFYRAVSSTLLRVGPYQGGHGCLTIPFSRGVCGAAARTRTTQLVPDVNAFTDHIACSTTTQSEIVVPVLRRDGSPLAVLDVDSNIPAAFTPCDATHLESLCTALGHRYGNSPP